MSVGTSWKTAVGIPMGIPMGITVALSLAVAGCDLDRTAGASGTPGVVTLPETTNPITTPYVPVDADGDGFTADVDCDDNDDQIYPGALEIVGDEIDQDCDGEEICWDDSDDDGSRHATNTRASADLSCTGPREGRTTDPIDCDDDDPTRYVGAQEVIGDGIDQDCDGHDKCYRDLDEDGYGTDVVVVATGATCATEDQEATVAGDCDDDDPSVNPSATEGVADGVDQDCDGLELCYIDTDGDGWGEGDLVWSEYLDCIGPGVAAIDGDTCIGFDDNIDPDLDGVPTGCDPCPYDYFDDSDGDGVCDSDDVCPGFDDNLDTDGDGVPNGCDTCDSPYDSDGDGVPDDCDICPGSDDNVDTDGDGVPDGCDDCASGVDSDGDGVCDEHDICPGYDDNVDSDGDGIPDGCDTDTDTGTMSWVDSDGDGIPDAVDPEPTHDGGAGPGRPPTPEIGCGCGPWSRSGPLGSGWVAVVVAAALLLRRGRDRAPPAGRAYGRAPG